MAMFKGIVLAAAVAMPLTSTICAAQVYSSPNGSEPPTGAFGGGGYQVFPDTGVSGTPRGYTVQTPPASAVPFGETYSVSPQTGPSGTFQGWSISPR